jgi:hypothetical protein
VIGLVLESPLIPLAQPPTLLPPGNPVLFVTIWRRDNNGVRNRTRERARPDAVLVGDRFLTSPQVLPYFDDCLTEGTKEATIGREG